VQVDDKIRVAEPRYGSIDREMPCAVVGAAADADARQMVSEVATETARPQRRQLTAQTDQDGGRTIRLLCRAGSRLCAIPIEHVIEVLRVLPIEPVSGAPRYVLGLCIIRGSAVPVVDAGLLLGDQATKSERLITIRTGDRTIALAAEAVLGIWAIGTETFNELPPLLRNAAGETIASIGVLDSELLFLLRTARIVPADLLDRLDREGAST
jgi:purine-binding chemotaxis protein CheW